VVVGVNGSGKTPTIAKLAAQLQERGQPTLLAAADTFRAAATEQLSVWAERLGVEVVAPSMKGNSTTSMDLSAFGFDDSGCVICCPQGKAPEKITHKHKKDRYVGCFAVECCRSCPQVVDCPVQPGKKYYYLRYRGKEHRLAQRRRFERTEEFIDRYRWRAGIEATMSEYATLTGVKRLRVRGMAAVRYCAILKAAGLNLMRAARVQRARMKARLRAAAAASQRLRLHLLAFQRAICRPDPKMGRILSSQQGPGRRRPRIGCLTFYESIKLY